MHPDPTSPAGTLRWSVPVAVTAVALVLALLAAALSGAVAPLVIGDAGPLVRWGMVGLRAVHHLAAALTIGLLVVAAFLAREGPSTDRRGTAARTAALSALVWAATALGILVLGFGDLAGLAPSAPGYLSQLGANLLSLEVVRLRLIEVLLLGLLVPVTALVRTRIGLAWATLLALVTLLPLAFGGHSSAASGHETAVTALGLHLVGITVWVGGLMAIALMLPVLGPALPDTVRRFSTLATWSFGLVALSGVLLALPTAQDREDLLTGYWALIGLKVVLLGVLFAAGLAQRRAVIARDVDRPALFARLALGELLVMGAAVGLGVALGRTPPPVLDPVDVGDPAYALTGFPMPPEWAWGRLLDTWAINWLFLLGAALAVGLYAVGMARLRRRGDPWPAWKAFLWVLGWAVFVYVTSGAPGVYGRVMFSMHMVVHMALMMAVPMLLVPASAITLAYRVLPARKDRTLGPREVLLAAVHSRWARLVVNPVVAGVVFFASLVVFYYSGLLEWALTSHVGHVVMVVHFTLTGYAFVWSLIGTDPGPPKWPALFRLLVVLATLAAHAFFGVAMMTGTWLLAPEFYKTVAVPWVPDLLADQQLGGSIAWGVGEVPTVILMLLVVLDWMRRDERERVRTDRRADRDGDAELAAYNARLQAMAGREGARR